MKKPHFTLLSLSNCCLLTINDSLENELIPKTVGLLYTVKNTLFMASSLWTVKECIWILHSLCKDSLVERETVCEDRRTVPFLLALLGKNFQVGGHTPTNELQDWTRCFLVLLSENHPRVLEVHTLIVTLNFGVILAGIHLSKGLPCIHKSTYIAMILSQSGDQLTTLLEHKLQHEDEDEPSDLIDELIFILYMISYCIETFGSHKIHLDIMEFAFVILVRCARKEELRARLAMDLANNILRMRSQHYLIPAFVLKKLTGEESIKRRARELLRLLRTQLEAMHHEDLSSLFDSLEIR